MTVDLALIRSLLGARDYPTLFVDELGWDRVAAMGYSIAVGESRYTVHPIAEKRGAVAFSVDSLPDRVTRAAIEREVAKLHFEHLIFFADGNSDSQLLQWAKREPGRPVALHDHRVLPGQSGQGLAERLASLSIALSEESGLTLTGVAARMQRSFDAEPVTRAFYEQFRKEHDAFVSFISGIPDADDQQWYASLMMNRLMFTYFIQKKGFLDGDVDYLSNRLAALSQGKGETPFLTFYRLFLKRLFHEGFGRDKTRRGKDFDALIGTIPYLNGGLFDEHDLERRYPTIDIPNEAFGQLFGFFDRYTWHLDERPIGNGNEINPDVLGYIFEKYINQKELGAYYTREDITDYISRNTVVPLLLRRAQEACAVAFRRPGPIWSLLSENPDRYIADELLHGSTLELPPDVAQGQHDVDKRETWRVPAPATHGLIRETWREVLERREYLKSTRDALKHDAFESADNLVRYNLDLVQFAQDIVDNSEGPEVLRAFYGALTGLSVLDPTCGSGAFLFAALAILEPLYEACLERMRALIDDPGVLPHDPMDDFRAILDAAAAHPNQRYFVLKSILVRNLYGVDLVEEGVEICKLRLFLKLVAQVDSVAALEPLPDIDLNVRAGNTLVGFVDMAHVRGPTVLDFEDQQSGVEAAASSVDGLFTRFRDLQLADTVDGEVLGGIKVALKDGLAKLGDQLDQYMASNYGVSPADFEEWRDTHKPFHWCAEFYGILKRGGFDVVLGNPPYMELNALRGYDVQGYRTQSSGNTYALVLERSIDLGKADSRHGFIVPISSVSTDRYASLQSLLRSTDLVFSAFDDRPSRLFDGLEHIRLAILLWGPPTAGSPAVASTRYNKWTAEERSQLFGRLTFVPAERSLVPGSLPKLSCALEASIIEKLATVGRTLGSFLVKASGSTISYSRKVGYFLQVLNFTPRVIDGAGRLRDPSEFKDLHFRSSGQATAALGVLNSSLFYWFITVHSDCRHVNKREVSAMRVDLERLHLSQPSLTDAVDRLMTNLMATSEDRIMRFAHDTLTVQCILPRSSKPILDEIDRIIGAHFGLTPEEIDFIVNYDVRFRTGDQAGQPL